MFLFILKFLHSGNLYRKCLFTKNIKIQIFFQKESQKVISFNNSTIPRESTGTLPKSGNTRDILSFS